MERTRERGTTLVVGGAGYIGSHVLLELAALGEQVVVLDNLSSGSKDALLNGEQLEVANVGDQKALSRIFLQYKPQTVIHFAASIDVGESVKDPIKYYSNNTMNTLLLLQACAEHKVENFIFSSTAAVYGSSTADIVDEQHSTVPLSPYGWSKLMSEQIIRDVAAATGLHFVILRYFNVAGADPQGRIGQRGEAHHLLKVCLDVAQGKRKEVAIFGTDYPTPDGTGIRDYIHVVDLAAAHISALTHLRRGGESDVFNVGYGQGYSVKEMIQAVKDVTGKDIPFKETQRRAGDSAKVVADSSKIRNVMHWKPVHNDLATIVRDAWNWQSRQ